jgi:hypothetical protein
MDNRNKRIKLKKKSTISSEDTSTVSKIDSLISQVKIDNKKSFNRPSSSIPFMKIFILSIVVLSSSFVLISALNSPSHAPSSSIDKELPDNMIYQYDPNLLSEDYINNAYDYAKTNSLLLEQLKCYCGCESFHDNNRQCFWKDDGSLDSHAETCGVCVYIALAAKQLNEEGWTAQEIRAYIDSKY